MLLEDDHELIIKEFLAMTIGSICLFSLVGLPVCLSGLLILSAIRTLIFLSKMAIKLVTKAILESFQTTFRSLADLFLSPFVPRIAVSLKFRTFQLCRKVWIGITFLLDPPRDEEIVEDDPTIYVYDPRGRTFQPFDPNWQPFLGEYKRKLARKRYIQKIRQWREETSLEDGIRGTSAGCTTHQITPSRKAAATGWNALPPTRQQRRQLTVLTSSNGRVVVTRKEEGSLSPPGILAAATDSETDASSHDDMSLLEVVVEHDASSELIVRQ